MAERFAEPEKEARPPFSGEGAPQCGLLLVGLSLPVQLVEALLRGSLRGLNQTVPLEPRLDDSDPPVVLRLAPGLADIPRQTRSARRPGRWSPEAR